MKICVSPAMAFKHCVGSAGTRSLLALLLLVYISIPSTIFSQTIPLTFTPIPYTDPDIISPGRGAEQWDNGLEGIKYPTPDSNQRSMDVYYRFCWSKMEGDSAGSYDWTQFDDLMQQAIDNRQKMSFGIMPVYDGIGTVEYDGARSAYPLYLHKLMQSGTTNTKDWISHGVWIPNWNSTYYVTRLRALHEALYKHIMATSYKGVAFKDAIYCIDIRGYGNYGEWHNAGIVERMEDYPIGRRAGVATLRTIIAHHTQVFSQWPLTLMIAAFDADQFDAIMNPAELTYYALTTKNAWGPLGWRRDQWGATDKYLDQILKNNDKTYADSPPFKDWIVSRYLTSPITGEPPRYVNEGGPCQLWDIERQISDYGATSYGNGNWGVQLSECGQQNARAAFKRAGYRIILQGGSITSNITAGKPVSITLQWKNIGIAPTYENWNVIFELKNDSNVTVWSGTSKFKPKRFVPADTATNITDIYTLPATIAVGSYKLNVIIKDPAGYRAPFPLAIKGRNADGSYTIRNINVSPVNCVPPVGKIRHSTACNGQAFSLVLDSASGRSPYDVTINGTTYNNVSVGQTITTINSPLEKIFTAIPSPASYEDAPVELGVKFKSSIAGYIKGIRFFSSNSPAGKYTGHLWTAAGQLIDSAVFSTVTASGWQEVLFAKPILIKADTIYVASYHSAAGHYVGTASGLASSVTNGSLTALGNGVSGVNGLFSYGNSPTFPSNSFNATNYWVDVLFTPNSYTFNLTSITDSTGCNNSGALQTLTVDAGKCDTTTIPPPVVLPTVTIGNSSFCTGKAFNIYLASANGSGPYDLTINGTAYNDIQVGQTITNISPSAATQKIWTSTPSPTSSEDSPVELGVKFQSSTPGFIKGIRFFSSTSPSGKYTGHLWTSTGTLLDSVVFTNITASGWQEALFSTPVAIQANTTYIASYHTASGHYVATPGGLTSAATNGTLTALANNATAGGNGLYSYGANPTFPANSFNAANYWVDVMFSNNTVNSYTFNLTSVTDSTGLTNNGSLQTLIVNAVNCDSTTVPPPVVLPTATLSNTSFCTGKAFTIYLGSATGPGPYDLVINGTTYNDIRVGQTITTLNPTITTQKIWDTIPSPKSSEDSPVELGVKFQSSTPGFIKGIRFFSSTSPSGKYTGHLWTSTGILLDSVVFTNVTASGWQEALFTTPVAVLANTTYVVSYHTASGHYAATPAGLTNAVINGPLTALDNITAGGNGLYGYGTNPTFPTSSYNAANYWVDVMFSNNTVNSYTFNLTSVTDSTGLTNNGPLQTLTVNASNCDTTTVPPPPVVLPTALIGNSSFCTGQAFNIYLDSATGPGPYDLTINGVTYTDIQIGQTITTLSPSTTTQTIWDTIPSPKSSEDSPVELGVKFQSSTPGFIKGIRFFSPAGPSGKYTGHLWTATGTLLDSVVFTNVTASGWQEALFSTPIAVLANTTYVASYHTASGHYAATTGGLTNAVTNGPLTALDNITAGGNGLYGYGVNRTFPANSFNAANYWVDVMFSNNTVNSYTFTLTSVTDSTGLTKSGTLQTLSVTPTNCQEGLRASGNTPAAKQVNLSGTLSPVTKRPAVQLAGIKTYQLEQNYPNPFRNETRIQYSLPVASSVNLSLFDMNGRLIKVIVNGSREKGTHTVSFNSGMLSSGLYFYKIQAGNFSAVKKMIIQ